MSNHLQNETSIYLLAHAKDPVNWYPWGDEAFIKAEQLDLPIFLSIGYSTCHWCHVMAKSCFQDKDIAAYLNEHFISIKVDKEKRPDIDSIYMKVTQAFTGRGGWPMSIFLTEKKVPFFAGTYFPKNTQGNMIGLLELLKTINYHWHNNRAKLISTGDEIVDALQEKNKTSSANNIFLIDKAIDELYDSFDEENGGFGTAPKFTVSHKLMFLLNCYQKRKDSELLRIVEKTMIAMYSGGIFDHIGYGFCRYSTDNYFLVPHFEKMLIDNALLLEAYCMLYNITKKNIYKEIAEKIALYVKREMTANDGAFYTSQDADINGNEGEYYLFTPEEITTVLTTDAQIVNESLGITKDGNFQGKSIPNLLNGLHNLPLKSINALYNYRIKRHNLLTDDTIITSSNSLMIASLVSLYRITNNKAYLNSAQKAECFIESKLYSDGKLYSSYRLGRGSLGFIDDYSFYIYALLHLYDATLDNKYLFKARTITKTVIEDFYDNENGGFFINSLLHEQLIIRPKESHDGATPSGNSIMCYNLVRLYYLGCDESVELVLKKQLDYIGSIAKDYPADYTSYLSALYDFYEPPALITVVGKTNLSAIPLQVSCNTIIKVTNDTTNYPLINSNPTYYICKDRVCLPPTNELHSV